MDPLLARPAANIRRRLGPAWFRRDAGAERLLPAEWRDEQVRQERTRAASRRLEPAIVSALQDLNPVRSPSVQTHLDQLATGAAVVVTGQQPGLFLGPWYTLVKALAAIEWAKRLSAESGVPVVPVFWLQSEDHDFHEVASCWWFESGGELRESHLDEPQGEGRVSMGVRSLPDAVGAMCDRLCASFGDAAWADEEAERLRRHYVPGRSWTTAFAGFLSEVCAARGLLIFDPRHPLVRAEAVKTHRFALESCEAIEDALLQRSDELASAGFGAQVPVRPEALSFFHPNGELGPRFRPRPGVEGWRLPGRGSPVDPVELLHRLDARPECFSTSALLRPLLQDTLLPAAAYVGGPGEVSYLAQIQPLYRLGGIRPSMVVPRPRLRVLEPWTQRLLKRWDLTPDAVGPSVDDTLRRMDRPPGASPGALRRELDEAQRPLLNRVRGLGGDMDGPQRAFERQVHRARERLIAKYERIRQRRDRDRLAAAERLTTFLRPAGRPQERILGPIPFFARFGMEYVVGRVEAVLDLDDPQVRDVEI